VLDVVGELVAANLLGQLGPPVAGLLGHVVDRVAGGAHAHPPILAGSSDTAGVCRTRPRSLVTRRPHPVPMSREPASTTPAPTRTSGPRLSPSSSTPSSTETTTIG